MRFTDKVIVITGAGSGMGRAMAHQFAAEGAKLVVGEIVPERLTQLIDEIKATKGNIVGIAGNIAIRDDAEALIDLAINTHRHIDVLINNAGIMDMFTPTAEVTDELWRRVLGVNLDGPMFLARHALPHMLKQGSGVIVNIASVGGLVGGRAGVAYTVSKHGLIGLTRNIAWDYGPQNIRCVAICPGGVETAIGAGGVPNANGYARLEPFMATMMRMGKPEEIAQVAAFLASDEASFINGAIITADGGWLAG